MSAKTEPCPHCNRMFADRGGVYQHLKAKHGGKGKAAYRPQREESFADRAVQAEIDRAMGIYNFDQEWLLP